MHTESKKFYEMSLPERWADLQQTCQLSDSQVATLQAAGGLQLEQANRMIENVAGLYSLPLGIAQHFVINGVERLVPMVIEEPSVVAAASYMARLVKSGGGFTTSSDEPRMIGQMQLLDLPDPAEAAARILAQKERLLAATAEIDPLLIKLGGGPRDIVVRQLASDTLGTFLVLHLVYDVRDAMGANAVNTALERLTPLVEQISGGRAHLRILSNLADQRLARASCRIPLAALAFREFTAEQVRDGILEAWAFAEADPYRAATHNKGIMNGIDAVLLATGNDWRAVEAGAHAYAARSGRYTSLSTWRQDENGDLCGELELPMAVGTVGGATRVHPTAQTALKIMGVHNARELAETIAAVGLAQNLAAIRALATEGIQRGHMALHARQVAIAAGAAESQIESLAAQMVAEKTVRIDRAQEILAQWKQQAGEHD